MEIEPGASTSRIANAQNAAAKAEREAAERVTAAQKHVREADQEGQVQVDHIRDQYEKRTVVERARGDDYLESVRNRTYENLADFQHKSETEEHRLAREAEKNVHEIETQSARQTSEAEKRGETEIRETTKRNYTASEFERKRGSEEIEALKSRNTNEKAALFAEQEGTHQALAKKTTEARKTDEEKTKTAIEESSEHYQGVYEGALKQTKDTLADVNWKASRDVEALKRDTATKLSAYSSQKNDPFYKMVNIDAELREHDDQYVLTARIPPHERDRISINLNANSITISGKRKSDEVLEVEPGHTQRTSAYQSFSESLPLSWPVNPKFMTREWDGDQLVVRIPKRTTYEAPRAKKEVARATLERPNFPKNLPTEGDIVRDAAVVAENDTENTKPSHRKTASSTLG